MTPPHMAREGEGEREEKWDGGINKSQRKYRHAQDAIFNFLLLGVIASSNFPSNENELAEMEK